MNCVMNGIIIHYCMFKLYSYYGNTTAVIIKLNN